MIKKKQLETCGDKLTLRGVTPMYNNDKTRAEWKIHM